MQHSAAAGAHNLLLVYAVSGAGKTSVLNAGVIPKLVAEGFEVLPRGRVGVSVPGLDVDQQRNPYVLNLLCSLSPEQLRSAGIARAYALADIEPDLTRCLEQPGPLLEELAGHIAHDWLAPLGPRRVTLTWCR